MKISEIHVDDFGAWHDLSLADLSPRATVFYGPNEAGKTTLLNLIRSVLYGFSERRCKKYLPPAHGERAGGSIVVSDTSSSCRITRTAPADYLGGDGHLAIQSTEGQTRGNHLLTTMLSGVDETIFNNVFAVGLTQIQQLSSLSDTEAAQQLYGLATGVDRVSLYEVNQTLESKREEILPSTDRPERGRGRIETLLVQKEHLQRELHALRRDVGVHAKMRTEHRDVVLEIQAKEKSQKALERSANWSEVSEEVLKIWERCRKLNDRLARVGPLLDVPTHVAKRVKESFVQVKKLRQEWEQLRDERKGIKQRAAKLQGCDTLYQHSDEIHALDRRREHITSLETDVAKAKATVDELEFEISAELEAIGVEAGTKPDRLPSISDEIIEALRTPAQELRDLREAADTTRNLAESYRTEAERIKQELDTTAARFGGHDVLAAYRKRAGLVRNLEERLGLDDRRDDIVRQIEEAEEEANYWQQRSVLPWQGVLAVCAVFSAGGMLILAGLCNSWFEEIQARSLVPLITMGSALSAISLVIKHTLEGSALDRAESCRQQILMMQDEHEQAVHRSEELETKLKKTSPGQLDQRLLDARDELVELEEFLPLAERYQSLTREAQAAEHQAAIAVRMLKDARRGWKASLRTVGLPESLTPSQIGGMQGRVRGLTRLRQRLVDAKREWETQSRELETLRERLARLLSVAELISVPENLDAQLKKLVEELEQHTRSGREREQLRKRWEQLHDRQNRLSQSAQQLVRNRQQLMDAHGVPSLADFREARKQTQRCTQMRRQRDQLLGKIVELSNCKYSADQLQAMLDNRPTKLVDAIHEFHSQHETITNELAALQQRAESLKQKLDERRQDRRWEHKELALKCVEERIGEAVCEWRRSALISLVLDKVKKTYETKRQPVALAEASTHLERLTEGRYTRVWTPMGRDALCVDDREGHALPVEKLSRGTRELVFLALRLALVSSYARRGANMPIVLDDVFVNFDDRRAQAVAAVLSDIAHGGQQILIFTCHERIRSIFQNLGHDVRDLPLRAGLAAPPLAVPHNKLSEHAAESDVAVDVESEVVKVAVETAVQESAPEVAEATDTLEGLTLVEQREGRSTAVDEFDQFTPAWRDEWLEPLPDLAPSGEEDE